jgi:hypothetical protein
MRKMFVGLIATAAIVTSMSQVAFAQPRHARHAQAQATEATRDAYGSSSYEVAPWNPSVSAGNHTEQFEDPRTAVNGN